MANDNNEGWVKEDDQGANEDWVVENSELSNSLRNPGKGALGGAAIGVATKPFNPLIKKAVDVTVGAPEAGVKNPIYKVQPHEHPVQKWTGKMHVGDISAAKDARDFREANRLMMEAKAAEEKARKMADLKAFFGETPAAPAAKPATEKVADAIRGTSKAFTPEAEGMAGKLASAVGHTAGRALAGGQAGYQFYDALNRLKQGDYPGAAIGTVGAIGSGSALVPTPATRVIGTGVGLTAEMINFLRDHPELIPKLFPEMGGGNIQPQPNPITAVSPPQQMAQGGLVSGLDATYNMPLAGGASLSIGGQQPQPANPMLPQGGLAAIR